jgi:DNA-binding LytR/AlgR family response regulator
LLAREDDVEIVGEACSGGEAVQLTRDLAPDLALLDVQMPGGDGIRAAFELLPDDTDVIFVTAHEHHALDAFEVGAIDYLLKPVRRLRLIQALDRARRRRSARSQLTPPAREREDTPACQEPASAAEADGSDEAGMLWVPVTGGMARLSVDTILRVEAARDYVYLHTAERAFLLRGTMQQFDRRLTGSGLIRVHRSAMVRASAVDQIIRSGKTAYLQMTDGQRVPVGPSYRAALFAALGHSGSP